MAEEPLKAIFVGVGGRGRHYLEHLKDSPHVRPVALVDISREFLERERLAIGLPETACFTTLTDALRHTPADTVGVTTHARLHAQFVREAILAGKHVLVEKPFTCDLAEAVRLVELADANGVKIVVTQQIRYFRAELTMRRLMREQAYGPPGFGHMHHYKPRSGHYPLSDHMQLWQMTVHEIDSLLSVLAQHKVTRVFGYSFEPSWGNWPTPSSAVATIEFDGSIPFTLVSTSQARGSAYEFRIECAQATLVQRGPLQDIPTTLHAEYQDGSVVPLPLDAAGIDDEPGDGINWVARLLYEYVIEGVEPEVSGRRNLDVLRVTDAIIRSTETGQAISLDNSSQPHDEGRGLELG